MNAPIEVYNVKLTAARFWGVFWIDATSNETAQEGFLNIARRCKQQQNISSVQEWLSGRDHWLLVIDNADDPALDISKYFPAGHQGTILITTRNPDCTKHSTVGSCRVDQMSPKDAVTLLLKSARVEEAERENGGKCAEEIVEVLGYLALAIVQAGAVC